MAIQRIVDNDNMPPKGPDGRRLPMNMALRPTHMVRPMPVALGV